MNRLIAALALALLVGTPARAASTYSVSTDASSTTLKLNGRLHMQTLAGVEQLVIDSVKGLFTWTYGIQASTASFTGTGNGTYSVTTSSGISVAAGGVTAPWFSASTGFFGSLFGNATTATTATSATNIAGGAAGSTPYQTGSGATSFVAAAAGKLWSIVGTTPAWLEYLPETVTISTANVTPGFNAASRLVQLNGSAQYPALDGSLISGISGTLSGGTAGGTARWTGPTTLSTGAFTDNGATVTAPSGSAFILLGASNVETFLSSQTFSAVSAITVGMTVLSSSTVHCVVNAIQNTSNGYPQITFNSDTTSGHYSYVGVGESIGGAINSGANSSANIPPLNLAQVPTAGSHYSFNVEYNTTFTDETQVYGGGMQLNGNWAMNTYGGRWTSGPPTTMTITPSAGTMTGYIKCTKLAY